MPKFTELMEAEKARLDKVFDEITEKIAALEAERETISRERAAINTYEQALQPKQSRKAGSRKGSRREEVLDHIKTHPAIKRADLLSHFGVKGNKAAEQAFSNLLQNMKKAKLISGQDGQYTAL